MVKQKRSILRWLYSLFWKLTLLFVLLFRFVPLKTLTRYRNLEWISMCSRNQYQTLAGFVIYKLKRLPKRTDAFVHKGYKFEVLDLEGVRVEQLLVTKIP